MTLQHVDRNISPANYRHLAPDQLLVTNIFYTIQGEGPYAGCPAVFVRLAGCNRGAKEDMGCKFCDTQFYFDKGVVMTFAEITNRMSDLLDGRVALTVITGGEPMLQDNLAGFIHHHRDAFPARSIQIESNGDRLPDGFPDDGRAQLVVSPKVTKNGYRVPSQELIRRVMCFKFVISADPESPYYNIPDWALTMLRRERVYVSPETVYNRPLVQGERASIWDRHQIDVAQTRLNYKRAAELCLEYGLRMSVQSHLFYEVE